MAINSFLQVFVREEKSSVYRGLKLVSPEIYKIIKTRKRVKNKKKCKNQ